MLAAVAADARRAEALLADLPVTPSELVLPPLAAMPPVPVELRERIEQLRTQIDELQAQLAETLRGWQPPRRMVLAGAVPRPPVYVDRRL